MVKAEVKLGAKDSLRGLKLPTFLDDPSSFLIRG
jgi:hypothetical protein